MITYKMSDNRWSRFENVIYQALAVQAINDNTRKKLKHTAAKMGFYPDQADEIIDACTYEFQRQHPYSI